MGILTQMRIRELVVVSALVAVSVAFAGRAQAIPVADAVGESPISSPAAPYVSVEDVATPDFQAPEETGGKSEIVIVSPVSTASEKTDLPELSSPHASSAALPEISIKPKSNLMAVLRTWSQSNEVKPLQSKVKSEAALAAVFIIQDGKAVAPQVTCQPQNKLPRLPVCPINSIY